MPYELEIITFRLWFDRHVSFYDFKLVSGILKLDRWNGVSETKGMQGRLESKNHPESQK